MFALREAQTAFAAALRGGPDHCPDGLFEEARDRVLLGLKVHANTVSHARLVALEESFPHTRAAMGESAFNTVSRAWLDAGLGGHASLALIGKAFPDWLARQEDGAAFALLARFEWLWLESYHSADALPLCHEAVHAMQPEHLLILTVAPHPASRLTVCDDRIAGILGLPESTSHLLIARPEASVLVHPLTMPAADLLAAFDGRRKISEVLETFWAAWPNEDAVAGINHLLALGVLTMETAS